MNLTPLKNRLLLPEYGRNVQTMVQFLSTIEDRDQRNTQAQIVIATMANVYPQRRDTQEFRNMLYDHLYMIADYELDIDCPFEKPDPDQFSPIPQRVPYTQRYIVQKQYGAIVPRVAQQIAIMEDPVAQKAVAVSLARFMRQKSYDYNREFPSDEMIIGDLYDMTGGVVKLDASAFEGSQIMQRPQTPRGNNNQRNNKMRSRKSSQRP